MCGYELNEQAEDALVKLNARPVREGANLRIINVDAQSGLLFKTRVDEVWLASPIQVYLDLQRHHGRAPELAEHLREEKDWFLDEQT